MVEIPTAHRDHLVYAPSQWETVKTKFGSQNLATKFGNHLCMATKIGRQY